MKHQEVNVDFWAMLKSMITYVVLSAVGWMILRMFNTIYTLPRRMATQQNTIQNTLQELQKRYPDLNFTEEELKDAQKEIDSWTKELDDKDKSETITNITETTAVEEDKKTN